MTDSTSAGSSKDGVLPLYAEASAAEIQDAVQRLASVPMNISMEGWQDISSILLGGAARLARLERERPAPETDAGTAAGLTMAQAISEAEDLLECAQPADNLEAATDDDWYEQRRQWMLRNTFRPHELKASEHLDPLCNCPVDSWGIVRCQEDSGIVRCRAEVNAENGGPAHD